MNAKQAITKLRKIIGPAFAYRSDPKAPTAEEREAIRAMWLAAKQRADAAVLARKTRHERLLAGDAMYQRLKQEAAQAECERDTIGGELHRMRVCVGLDNGFFFLVKAEGDNWAEVVEKVTAKVKA